MTFSHISRRFEKPQPIRLECWRCSSTEAVQRTNVAFLSPAERAKTTDANVPLCLGCRVKAAPSCTICAATEHITHVPVSQLPHDRRVNALVRGEATVAICANCAEHKNTRLKKERTY
jgi:hypothetical protein